MRNFEGIKITEIPEEKIEPNSVRITENSDADNFDDCLLTEKEKLLRAKQELELIDFDDCGINTQLVVDKNDDNYEECRKR